MKRKQLISSSLLAFIGSFALAFMIDQGQITALAENVPFASVQKLLVSSNNIKETSDISMRNDAMIETTENLYITMDSDDDSISSAIRFGTDASKLDDDFSEIMRIQEDGKIGIMTEIPEATLDVNGVIRAQKLVLEANPDSDISLAKNAKIQAEESMTFYINQAGEENSFRFKNKKEELVRIDEHGNMGIGVKYPEAKLHIKGDIKLEDEDHLACNQDTVGAIKFHEDHFYGCNSKGWVRLDSATAQKEITEPVIEISIDMQETPAEKYVLANTDEILAGVFNVYSYGEDIEIDTLTVQVNNIDTEDQFGMDIRNDIEGINTISLYDENQNPIINKDQERVETSIVDQDGKFVMENIGLRLAKDEIKKIYVYIETNDISPSGDARSGDAFNIMMSIDENDVKGEGVISSRPVKFISDRKTTTEPTNIIYVLNNLITPKLTEEQNATLSTDETELISIEIDPMGDNKAFLRSFTPTIETRGSVKIKSISLYSGASKIGTGSLKKDGKWEIKMKAPSANVRNLRIDSVPYNEIRPGGEIFTIKAILSNLKKGDDLVVTLNPKEDINWRDFGVYGDNGIDINSTIADEKEFKNILTH
ncbi:MAG: hypothetical protein N4A36_00865 [Candidatus Gracilibacteria bacterium]|jgi:hypothetical protein|nr:hypothetical protein [Candidatus Gracilibacteria bacterium]